MRWTVDPENSVRYRAYTHKSSTMLYELTKEMVERAEKNRNHPYFPYRGPSLVEYEKAELEGMKYVAMNLTGSTVYAKGDKELSLEEIMYGGK